MKIQNTESYIIRARAPLELEKGFLIVPKEPGIGVILDEQCLKKNREPFSERTIKTLLHENGSVADS